MDDPSRADTGECPHSDPSHSGVSPADAPRARLSTPEPTTSERQRVEAPESCRSSLDVALWGFFSSHAVAIVTQRFLESVLAHAHAELAVLYRYEEGTGLRVVGLAGSGLSAHGLGQVVPPGGVLHAALESAEPIELAGVSPDVDPRPREEPAGTAVLLCSRIGADAAPWGVLAMFRRSPARSFAVEERCQARYLADFASLALQNAQSYEGLVEVARNDPLTGLANHGHFWSTLTAEMSRAHRYVRQLSLVMIDVDHFKGYNDTRGHLAGDRALIQVARCIEGRCRASDIAARYGGDEFAAVLPETPLVGALSFGEKIRSAVEAIDLRTVSGERLTVSIGVASYPDSAHTAPELARVADEQLYRAKSKGRNCVCGIGYESR